MVSCDDLKGNEYHYFPPAVVLVVLGGLGHGYLELGVIGLWLTHLLACHALGFASYILIRMMCLCS